MMKMIITSKLIKKVNSQGKKLTPAQWFTINSYIAMGQWDILEILQYIKPEFIYDSIEKMQKQLREKKK